jgi:flagellar biosynthetic protein FliR
MEFEPGTLEAFGLYLVRTSALVLAAPLIGTGSTFSGYKVGLIGVLAIVTYMTSGAPLPGEIGPMTFGLYAGREVIIGLSLAFVLQAVLVAVRVAGELIGHEMAFSMSNVVDPATGVNSPLVTHLYETMFFLALLAVDGHHWVIRALSASYGRAPVGALDAGRALPEVALAMFEQMFAAGLTFAAPILVLLMLVSLLIGLLTRAVPQINVLEFGFNLRIVAGLAGMLLFAPLLAPALQALLDHLLEGLNASLDALEVV